MTDNAESPNPQKTARPGRMMQATWQGRTYSIPEMWVAGYCQGGRHTILDAAALWALYEQLDEQETTAEQVSGPEQ